MSGVNLRFARGGMLMIECVSFAAIRPPQLLQLFESCCCSSSSSSSSSSHPSSGIRTMPTLTRWYCSECPWSPCSAGPWKKHNSSYFGEECSG
jgi:hypothetical protein